MSTLDDFFAKKDRKKKGGKTGDGSRNERAETSGGKKEKTVDITNNFKYISDNGDEWLDFEENRDKDYSGLKIQSLSIKDKEQVQYEQKQAELNEEAKSSGNIWSAKTQQNQQAAEGEEKAEKEAEKQEPAEEEKPKEPEAPAVKNVPKYLPPSLRNTREEAPLKKVNKNKAPVLDSANFPTLG